MAIKVRCPHCSSVIQAADQFADREVKCPTCSAAIKVPTMAAKAAPVPVVPLEPAP